MKKSKKWAIYSLKGGQGKTSTAVNLALEMGYGIITNDVYSPIEEILPAERVLKLHPGQELPSERDLEGMDIIFDFGGYLDSRVIPALEMSDYVIIPVTEFDKLNTQGFVSTVGEVKNHNKNIIILLNKVDKEAAKEVREELKKHKYPYPVFEIKKSSALKKIIEEKKSVSELVGEGGLNKYFFKPVEEQFRSLIDYLNNN